jgi:hypothetical protein
MKYDLICVGMALVDSIPEAEALFVLTDGSVQTTAGFPAA